MAKAFRVRAGDGRRGYQNRGSVRVNQTADGVDLNEIWDEVAAVLELHNSHQSAITSLLSYRTIHTGEAVPQNLRSERFEVATEYGIPTGIGEVDYVKLGFTFRDRDIRIASTWKYLREATAAELTDRMTRVLAADTDTITKLVLKRIFEPVKYINDKMIGCYGLWGGTTYNDGIIPPKHMGKSFAGDHDHYLKSTSTVLDAQDVENGIRHIREHGYGQEFGGRFILLVHPEDVEASLMTSWRAGVEYRTGGPLPKFDFIVSPNAPAYLSAEEVHGEKPPADYNGVPVLGSYAGALVIQSYLVPKGWATIFATGGQNSTDNVVGLREHKKADYRGLRIIAGLGPYPLQDSFLTRGIGTGVRHRGAAVAIQITTNSSYAAPTFDVE